MDDEQQNDVAAGEMTQRFDLMVFTDELIGDLRALRANKISVKEANARALLAKNILRSVQLVIQARKYLEASAKQISAEKVDN